jgi:uncharacterized protein YraI
MNTQSRIRTIFFAGVIATSMLMGGNLLSAQSAPTFTTSGTINVRSGDGTQFTIRDTVNGVLTITGRNNFDANRNCTGNFPTDADMWLRVDNNGVEGWVSRCIGEIDGSLSALPVVSPSNAVLIDNQVNTSAFLSGNLLGDEPSGKFVVAFVLSERGNVRENPSINANRIAVLTFSNDPDNATAIYVIGRSADGFWAQVQYTVGDTTTTGWMARTLLQLPSGWTTRVDAR